VRAWCAELAKGGGDPNQYEQELEHILLEDIINGRLDDAGPLRDGRRLGLRLEIDGRPGFVEGHEIRALICCPIPAISLHRVVVMKEAVLDFANRRKLPPPSWWTDDNVTSKDAHSVTASPIPAPAHMARPRGRRPKKLGQVIEALSEDIRQGRLTEHALSNMLEKDLAASYGVSRDTARKARDAVLSAILPRKQLPSIPVCTECMARPRSASGFLRLSLDQSAVMYPAPEHSLWP